MAFGCSVDGPLVKSVSPMTRVSRVVSTTTKLSDDTDRRLTASAGYDSFVQVHWRVVSRRRRRPSMHEPLLGEHAEDFLHVVPAERFVGRERQLERRALDVIDEDVQVVGIDQRPLGRGVEEVRRVADDELIERRAARDHHRRRPAGAAAGAPGALPRRGNRPRIAGHHRDVERADVDAELERVGRDDRADGALAQPFLDLAAAHAADSRRDSRGSAPARRARPRSRPSDRS